MSFVTNCEKVVCVILRLQSIMLGFFVERICVLEVQVA